MRVFRVSADVDRYRWIMPHVPESELLNLNTFDCRSRLASWSVPSTSFYDRTMWEGDFAYYHPSVIVAGPSASTKLGRFFAMAGETLPLWCEGDEYSLLNVLECVDALNNDKTQWLVNSEGKRVEITRYAFDAEKLPDSSIFKMPQGCRGEVLVWEREESPEREFKAFVETHRLTGLLFELLWDSEVG